MSESKIKLGVEELESGFIVTNVIGQDVVRTACLNRQAVMSQLAELLGVQNFHVAGVDLGAEREVPGKKSNTGATTTSDSAATVVEEVDASPEGKPRTPVDSNNRDEALKWLAERGIDPKKGTKNPTLTKLIADTPVELPASHPSLRPESKAQVEADIDNPDLASGGCAMCGGTGELCTGIACPLCDGTGDTDIELSVPALQNMGNVILNSEACQKDGELRKRVINEALLPACAEHGASAVGKLAKDKVAPACASIIAKARAILDAPAEEPTDEEW